MSNQWQTNEFQGIQGGRHTHTQREREREKEREREREVSLRAPARMPRVDDALSGRGGRRTNPDKRLTPNLGQGDEL